MYVMCLLVIFTASAMRIHCLVICFLCRDVVMGDLETAESRLDDAYAANEKEKNLRYRNMHFVECVHTCTHYFFIRLSAEQRLSEVMSNLEKAAGAHSEEVTALQQSLLTQKQLASKFNDRVSYL